jgi:23S rRNA (uracil1939-C5)-methyltransferase
MLAAMTTSDGGAPPKDGPDAGSKPKTDEGRLRKGAVLELMAETLASNGDGVVERGELSVFVPGLLPGERAEVEIQAVGRQSRRAYATLKSLIEASPDRREAPCQHQGTCSGCPLMIASEPGQARLKRERLATLGLEVDALCGGAEPLGYRWSAKRVVTGKPGAVRLGSYRRGSHDFADMDRCLVDHPDLVAAAADARRVASRLKVVPYDEESGEGDLRYLWLKTNGRGDVLLTFVTASPDTRVRELAEALAEPFGVAWCVQPSKGNALRGEDLRLLRGEERLTVDLLGRSVEVGPLGFLQPNPPVAAMAYSDLVRGPESEELRGDLALDLYAGAGVTTALLRERFDRVAACESYPESAAALGVEPQGVEAFLDERLQQEDGPSPSLVVANPPRRGLGARVCEQLVELAGRRRNQDGAALRLHVMSCDPQALADDLRRLEAAGFQRLGLRAYDTLPQTAHIEVVAWLVAPA